MLNGVGAEVSYHDPHVARFSPDGISMKSQPLTEAYLAAQDCVVILADHESIDWQLIEQHAEIVLDTRNVLRRAAASAASRDEDSAAPPPEPLLDRWHEVRERRRRKWRLNRNRKLATKGIV